MDAPPVSARDNANTVAMIFLLNIEFVSFIDKIDVNDAHYSKEDR
jgi:hypothetical protein